MKKKVLITGITGMLGKDIRETFSKEYEVFGISREEQNQKNIFCGDIKDDNFTNYLLKQIDPEIIIHCAAIVNVDACELNSEEAERLHVSSTVNLASYKKNRTKFIYISTDSIFDGTKGNYSEESEPNPINNYARSKLRGEQVASSLNGKSLIIRTNIFGFHIPTKKSLVEWAIANFEWKTEIKGFSDVFFNPVYTKDLSETLKKIVEKFDISGILNIGSRNFMSKYEFLVQLATAFNYNSDLVKMASVQELAFAASRPQNTTLSIQKLSALNLIVPDVLEGITRLKMDWEKYKQNI